MNVYLKNDKTGLILDISNFKYYYLLEQFNIISKDVYIEVTQ